jgi:hypothetical protein
MPRSLLELKADMPDAEFVAFPVQSPDLDTRKWWKSPKGTRLLVLEYTKYLAILGRDFILSISHAFGDKGAHNNEVQPGSEDGAAASQAVSAQAKAAK